MNWALVVEDEPRLRDELVAELGTFAALLPALAEIAPAGSVEEALLVCRSRGDPALAFLDIQLPHSSGLQLAATLAADRTQVVLVTAYAAHALDAFAFGVSDYLLKPVQRPRLAACLEPAVGVEPVRTAAAPTEYLKWLAATTGRKIHLIALDDVIYLQSDQKYTRAVSRSRSDESSRLAQGLAQLLEEPLKTLLPRLNPDHFRQVHRGAVVNLREVLLVERDDSGGGLVRFRSISDEVRISAPFMRELRAFLE
jgi:DNA-binding LytR/AlgR family response regulator